jgi:hypothetical protein
LFFILVEDQKKTGDIILALAVANAVIKVYPGGG